MSSEWPFVSFEKAPLAIIDGDRGTNYPKQDEFSSSGFCLFLNTGNVTTEGFKFNECAFVTEDKDKLLRKGKLARRDIVLTTRGTLGNVVFFSEKVIYENIRINSGMVILRADKTHLLPYYLFLFLRSASFADQVKSLKSGSAQPQLPIRDMQRIVIPVPAIEDQEKICNIMANFDDRIALLRETNTTLEAIAQALFKSWFVDFDPVHAKQQGREPEGMDIDTAALFPDNFEESELGLVPKGWRVGVIEQATSVIIDYRGKTPKKLGRDWSSSGIPAVSAKNIKRGRLVEKRSMNFVDNDLFDIWMKDKLEAGDILMTSEAPLGELLYLAADHDFCLSQRVFALRANPINCFSTFLYFWLSSRNAQERLSSRATGTTVVGIRQSELRKVEVLFPPLPIQEKANDILSSCLLSIEKNEVENETLSILRDTLLPRLISGQLRLPETVDSDA